MERGLKDSNWVEVDPDGVHGFSAFKVWCDLSGENKGVTIIRKSLMLCLMTMKRF